MIKVTKNRLFLVVEIICFIVFVLLCMGLFYLVSNKDEKAMEVVDNTKKEISLNYLVNSNLGMELPIKLEKKEEEELYDLVKRLEFSPGETKCFVEAEYYLEYDNDKLYLDENCSLAILNEKEYTIDKGGKELSEFLEKKISEQNNVYLFKFDQEKAESKLIELSDEDKNEIKNVWANHSKETMTMNLAIMLQYYLYIDGDVIGIDELDSYVSYNSDAGNIMILNQDMQAILGKYIELSNGCCSCCPDLQPGEVCIDACCPCN